MPIPDLIGGVLPPGVHDCTLEEIREAFGRFKGSDRRPSLMDALRRFVSDVKSAEVADHIIVNGSFITAKEAPSDIDIILAIDAGFDMSEDLRPIQENVLSKRRVRRRYRFDLLAAPVGSSTYERYVRYFSQVKQDPERVKGLIRVRP